MNIHFRDVQAGIVEARAVIEIEPGVFLNEITILNIDDEIVVELPQKSFRGKNQREHFLDIITFENDDKKILWELQIKEAYRQWRKSNKKVLVYEDNPQTNTHFRSNKNRSNQKRNSFPKHSNIKKTDSEKQHFHRSYDKNKPKSSKGVFSDRLSRSFLSSKDKTKKGKNS